MAYRSTIAIGDEPLSLEAVEAIARRRVDIELSAAARARIRAGRAIVDRAVRERRPVYGVTTGVGSQKDFAVDPASINAFNDRLITAHATLAPGPAAETVTVRAALAIQLALFASGRSGVRPELAESLLARLQSDDLPAARLGSSVGASDIVAMSQLAAPLIARNSELAGSGPVPLGGLQAKEALALMNSNCLTLAGAALAVAECRRLLDVAALTAALSLEGFRGNPLAWSEAVDRARGQPGQLRAGHALRAALADSRLWQAGVSRLLQDPLSFRCVPQIHGAAESAYAFASELITRDLSAICDNPLIDLDAGTLISHGNMESTACALGLDALRIALAKLIVAAGERIHKLQWPGFSGLPNGLAAEQGAVGGVQFLNLGHIASAAVAAVCQAANPATLQFRGQICDGVEDVGGSAPLAVSETTRALAPAWNVLGVEAACAVWAITIRAVPVADLGNGVRAIAARVRPLLPIGREGEQLFDLGEVVTVLQQGPAATDADDAR